MPNRILKESICTSESLDCLSDKAEILFYRLIVQCDDYGRFDGRAAIIRSRCFPLKTDSIKDKDVEKYLNELVACDLIYLYESGGKRYLAMTGWENHQQVRSKRSKYPEPESICNQMISDDSKCPRNPIQSESNTESESVSESILCSEVQNTSEPPIYTLPLIDKTVFPITDRNIHSWSEAYPSVDIHAEIKKMIVWLEANPKNKKTRNGIMKFANSWLSRAQDGARTNRGRMSEAERIMQL